MQEIMSECLQNAQAWMPRGAEWKLSLREVKQEYLDGRYRHCAARCRTLLDGARHSVRTRRYSNICCICWKD
jgi:hypothetical protein